VRVLGVLARAQASEVFFASLFFRKKKTPALGMSHRRARRGFRDGFGVILGVLWLWGGAGSLRGARCGRVVA
jgi:hypothetical protein